MSQSSIAPLREVPSRPTKPPCSGDEPPFICPGLEAAAEEIGLIRSHVEWQTEFMLLMAKKLGLSYPRPPSLHPPKPQG
jgi:hypothetical protein